MAAKFASVRSSQGDGPQIADPTVRIFLGTLLPVPPVLFVDPYDYEGGGKRVSLRDGIEQLVRKTLFFRTSFADWVWSGHLIALLAMAGLVAHTY
jgi:hypothetical protein